MTSLNRASHFIPVYFTKTVTSVAGLVLLIGFASPTGIAMAADSDEGRVTFQQDVLPILAKHCQGCHSPGQIAPMSFLTYKTTRPWAAKIKAMVVDKKMPPVVGTPHYAVLTRGEGLTPAEISTLVFWVDHGAPEGATRNAKPAPQSGDHKK